MTAIRFRTFTLIFLLAALAGVSTGCSSKASMMTNQEQPMVASDALTATESVEVGKVVEAPIDREPANLGAGSSARGK